MNIVGLVPARCGSKSIANKNIKLLNGIPLLAYSIAAAILTRNIDGVLVSTDSEEYANIARQYGADIPFLRPVVISEDSSQDIEFIQHYIAFIKDNNLKIPEMIVLLRPTAPLRNIELVEKAVEYMNKNSEATSLRSAHRSQVIPYRLFKKTGKYMVPFLTHIKYREYFNFPRQAYEQAYQPNGYVDIIRPSVLQSSGLLFGDKIKIWETEKVADIDEMDDYDYTKKLIDDSKYTKLINYFKNNF